MKVNIIVEKHFSQIVGTCHQHQAKWICCLNWSRSTPFLQASIPANSPLFVYDFAFLHLTSLPACLFKEAVFFCIPPPPLIALLCLIPTKVFLI